MTVDETLVLKPKLILHNGAKTQFVFRFQNKLCILTSSFWYFSRPWCIYPWRVSLSPTGGRARSWAWRWTRGRLIALCRCEEKQKTIYLCLRNRTAPQGGEWEHWHGDLSQDAHYTQGQGAPCLYGPREHLVPACGFTRSPLDNQANILTVWVQHLFH